MLARGAPEGEIQAGSRRGPESPKIGDLSESGRMLALLWLAGYLAGHWLAGHWLAG